MSQNLCYNTVIDNTKHMTNMSTTTLIPVQNKQALIKDFDRLVKKAHMCGVEVPTITFGETVFKKTSTPGVMREMITVTVAGTAPKIGSYAFSGKVEDVGGTSGNLVVSIFGETVPEEYRHNDAENCDHCKINRRRS